MRDYLMSGVAGGALAGLVLAAVPAEATPVAKNVILMIADGCSWGCWDAAAYYQYGSRASMPYYNFPVQLGQTTTPLNTSSTPTGDPMPQVTYEPDKAWMKKEMPGTYTGPQGTTWSNSFEGYAYQRLNWTDSAASATAMASGEKSYNNAINWANQPTGTGEAIHPIITEVAKGLGKATGAISSVPFSHATPAGFGANDISRSNYTAIATDMLFGGALDVIMGGGNPNYDNDGRAVSTPNYRYIGESNHSAVMAGTGGWTVIESKSDFESLADGTLTPATSKVFGLPQVFETLQFNRTAAVQGSAATPSGVAYIQNVPALATMTKAALNVLDDDPDGLFLMVEGGAVDWAAHLKDTGVNPDGTSTGKTERLIEEMIDFNNSVEVVIEWVETHGGWDQTLVIINTDHGNGLPFGPLSDSEPFQPVANKGQSTIPGVLWHYDYHTNEATLLWAKGAGAELFYPLVDGVDPGLPMYAGFDAPCTYKDVASAGCYVSNSDVFSVMASAMVPVPATLVLFGFGAAALFSSSGMRRS
jgi:alkaline phosphatase